MRYCPPLQSLNRRVESQSRLPCPSRYPQHNRVCLAPGFSKGIFNKLFQRHDLTRLYGMSSIPSILVSLWEFYWLSLPEHCLESYLLSIGPGFARQLQEKRDMFQDLVLIKMRLKYWCLMQGQNVDTFKLSSVLSVTFKCYLQVSMRNWVITIDSLVVNAKMLLMPDGTKPPSACSLVFKKKKKVRQTEGFCFSWN